MNVSLYEHALSPKHRKMRANQLPVNQRRFQFACRPIAQHQGQHLLSWISVATLLAAQSRTAPAGLHDFPAGIQRLQYDLAAERQAGRRGHVRATHRSRNSHQLSASKAGYRHQSLHEIHRDKRERNNEHVRDRGSFEARFSQEKKKIAACHTSAHSRLRSQPRLQSQSQSYAQTLRRRRCSRSRITHANSSRSKMS